MLGFLSRLAAGALVFTMLVFALGEERYRVARSTPAAGASRILLERWQDGEWRQAGEGADRVRASYRDSYDRLAAIKAKYDPANLFRVNQNIKPQG